ncbi:hypothetical protein KAOT1_09401 [Kordia algicida OT-1]|uniref:Uncharacterized protein n=1 Tax=Kordia algicida OT-1 TaxID=391587 RepID=A9E3V8_9FLAO|nr:hypothetical protein [Kordia algicida]EDP95277.1 hypothetical protein KAOT1_09401 [Kordia algicida OT-1]
MKTLKNQSRKKLQFKSTLIANIHKTIMASIKGGTKPVPVPSGNSAYASQCGTQMCY